MIVVKNITDEEHRIELKEMINAYYDEALGKDWTNKIPFKTIRKMIGCAESYTNEDIKKLYGDKKIDNRIALGLYDDDDELVGFTSVVVFDDKVGGIYQIYIKPEHKAKFIKDFKGSMDATMSLKDSLDEYFRHNGADSIVMEAPHNMRYLLYMAQDMGFITKKVHYDATELAKSL